MITEDELEAFANELLEEQVKNNDAGRSKAKAN